MTDWLDHRAKCGKPLPPHARINAAQILRGMGNAAAQRQAVSVAIANNWQSLRVGDGKVQAGAASAPRTGRKTFDDYRAEAQQREAGGGS